nr:hypothetical protein B0A51_07907 [Rachicladosporium sp. CCFEE 5018]
MPPHSQRPDFATRDDYSSPATGANAIPLGWRDRTQTLERDRRSRSSAPSPSSSLADAIAEYDAEAIAAALALIALSRGEEGPQSSLANGTGTEGKPPESEETDR